MGKKILLVFAALILSVGVISVRADDVDNYKLYLEKQKQIIELEQKISESQGKQKTLASTIVYLDDKIALTQLQISQTEEELANLEKEIATLTVKISRLDTNLDEMSKLLISRIGAAYKRHYIKPMYLFLASGGFSDFFERNKYLQAAQQNDRKLLLDLQTSRDSTQQQKDLKEAKQNELANLQIKQQAQKKSLASQKAGKQELLEATRNDEKRFQDLKIAIQADLASITQALAGGAVKIGKVTTNDVIGVVGSSGCSTGPHLHFEVFMNAKVEGGGLATGNRVDPKSYLEDGQYKRPVPGYPEKVTTWYGEIYFLGVHTGIDIANPTGTPIYPIASGTAYFVSSACPYNISGGSPIGKGILVDHENGLATLYWHIP